MMPNRAVRTTVLIAALLAALFAGCAAMEPGADGPAVDAPTYRVGDRWEYHVSDGFRLPVEWDETREITAIAPDRITMRVIQRGPKVDNTRTELWPAPGLLRVGAIVDEETRRFATPVKVYDFPLARGKVWNQFVDNTNETTTKDGQFNRYVSVGGWESVTTPAGTFKAIRMRVFMTLDDAETWRYATECNYLVWWSPDVRGVVREQKEAQYLDKGVRRSPISIRSQHATVVLLRFTPGAT